jgi:NAD(P)-dependent dehydrogenase (short-subunit alcohol dehydrogenase family)
MKCCLELKADVFIYLISEHLFCMKGELKMSERLKDRIAVVTGGTSGIGLASAKEFVRQGAKVAVLARTQDKADKVVAEIGEGAIAFVGDVSDLPSIDAFYSSVAEKLGKIDVVFANAGIADRTILEEVDEAAFDKVVNVNFRGAYFSVKYAAPYLNEGASVILTSSCLDEMGMGGLSVYAATKAAVRSLARSFTPDLKKYGARINVLSPGPVATDIEKKAGFSKQDYDAYSGSIGGMLAAGRMGQVEEMAAVAVFLASDDSSFMYGAEVQADGGRTNYP